MNKIFGFRSNTPWKKIVAGVWYIGWLVMVVLSLAAGPTVEAGGGDVVIFKVAGAFFSLGAIAVPLLLSDVPALKKLPLIGGDAAWQKVVGVVVAAVIWLVLFGLINMLHTPEYNAAVDAQQAAQQAQRDAQKAEEEAERQRAEAEAQAAKEKEEAEAQAAKEREEAEKAQREQEEAAAQENTSSESAEPAQEAEPAEPSQDEATAETNGARDAFISDLVADWGFTEAQASDAYAILDSVGCGDIEVMEGRMTEGTSLDAMRGMVNGHQVNFTADNKQVFYVQITGWKEMYYGWYVNWRGKLKYGIVDKKLSFDLYDSDTVDGGYVARYDAANDAVVPWGESL